MSQSTNSSSLSKEAITTLFQTKRDPLAREMLVHHYVPLILPVAKSYAKQHPYPIDVLGQIGIVGLLKAVDQYEKNDPSSFEDYAKTMISNELDAFLST